MIKNRYLNNKHCSENFCMGFTLLEIAIVLALAIVILGVFIYSAKTPEFLKTSRDTKRIADLNALKLAILTYIENSTTTDLDSKFFSQTGTDESNSTIFVSVASDKETISSPFVDPNNKSWIVNQPTSANLILINGQGWLPINFNELYKGLISELPVDPLNSYSQNYFYSYIFKRNDNSFEINANLESQKMSNNGVNDKESTDNGDNADLYEVGSDLTLFPDGFYR